MNQPQQNQIQVAASQNTLKGRYTNMVQISHHKEEFIMDFFFITAQGGALLSRMVTNPAHMKRMLLALEENIKRYENAFGTIEASKGESPTIGFQN